MVTNSEPEVEVFDVQVAEQEVALSEDHVRVEVFSKSTDVGSADKLTDGFGAIAASEPPPPPQEVIKKQIKPKDIIFRIVECIFVL